MKTDKIDFDAFSAPLTGINLIEAAAGTGKTYNIQTLTIRALLEKKLPVESLLILTFTDAAAAELKSRIFDIIQKTLKVATMGDEDIEKLSEKEKKNLERELKLIAGAENSGADREEIITRLHQAQVDFDRAQISTIHNFCANVLRDFSFECHCDAGFDVMGRDDKLLDEIAGDFMRSLLFRAAKPWDQASFFIWGKGAFIGLIQKLLSTPDIKLTAGKLINKKFDHYHADIKDRFEQLLQMPCDFSAFSGSDYYLASSGVKKLDAFEKFKKIIRHGSICRQDWDVIHALSSTSLENGLKKKNTENIRAAIQESSEIKLISDISDLAKLAQGALLLEAKDAIEQKMRKRKRQLNALSYNDLIFNVVEAVKNHPELVEALKDKFRLGIIDEFQDTDSNQCKILEKLFPENEPDRSLFLVGDPRQAIYGFRGCDLNSYLKFTDEIRKKRERYYTLRYNFRSTEPLLDKFNTIFGEHKCPFGKDSFTLPELEAGAKVGERKNPLRTPDGKDFPVFSIIRTEENSTTDLVVACIGDLMHKNLVICDEKDGKEQKRDLQLADIMVLTKTWVEAEKIKSALIKVNYPAVTVKCNSLFASRDAQQLLTFLQAVCHCGNPDLVARSFTTDICDLEYRSILDTDEETKAKYREQLEKLFLIWKREGFPVFFEALCSEFNIYDRYPQLVNGAQRLASFTALGAVLRDAYMRHRLSPNAILKFIADEIEKKDEETFPEPLGEDDSSVRLMSIHKSKGLQFPVVICADLDFNLNPKNTLYAYYSDENKTNILPLFCNDDDKNKSREQDFEEKLRLAYVAMTRAVNCCIVCFKDHHRSDTNRPFFPVMDYLAGCREFEPKPENESALNAAKSIENLDLPKEFFQEEPTLITGTPEKTADTELKAKVFAAPQRPLWKIKSFSSFAAGADNSAEVAELLLDTQENDEFANADFPVRRSENPFPRLTGKWFGDFLHKILAEGNFALDLSMLKEKISKRPPYPDMTPEEINYCAELLFNAVNIDLPGIGKLKELPCQDRLAEMRFNFAMNKELDPAELFRLAGLPVPESADVIAGGLLTGSIDLFFRQQNCYYILDWKSNLLDDYRRDALGSEMLEAKYRLQLLIYTVAAIKFLQLRKGKIFDEADYNKCFGGAYYLFLRGAIPGKSDAGIFFEKTDFATVQKAMELFS